MRDSDVRLLKLLGMIVSGSLVISATFFGYQYNNVSGALGQMQEKVLTKQAEIEKIVGEHKETASQVETLADSVKQTGAAMVLHIPELCGTDFSKEADGFSIVVNTEPNQGDLIKPRVSKIEGLESVVWVLEPPEAWPYPVVFCNAADSQNHADGCMIKLRASFDFKLRAVLFLQNGKVLALCQDIDAQ